MATYFTDFSEYSLGTPGDWTGRGGQSTGDIEVVDEGGQNALTWDGTVGEIVTWDEVDADPDRDDVEVAVLVLVQGTDNSDELNVLCRMDDADDFTHLMSQMRGGSRFRLARRVDGSYDNFTDLSDGELAPFWIRMRANGDDFRGKFWADGTTEPSGWDATTTQTDVTAAGRVGLERGGPTIRIGAFGVGTNGDTAPTSEPADTVDVAQSAPAATQSASIVAAVAVEAAQSAPAATQSATIVDPDAAAEPSPVTQHSSTLAQLIREGAQIATLCEIFAGGVKQDEIPIVDGQVSYDATSRVWRTCDVTLLGPIPTTPQSLLAPAGATLRLWKGATDWTGETLLEPVGVYAFEESGVDRGERTVKIAGYDYWQVVSDARWEEPYEIARGTNIIDALTDAVQSRLPDHLWQEPNATTATTSTGSHVWGEERENDPAKDIQGLASDHGLLISFDTAGRLTIEPVPDPDDAEPVANYTVGESPLLLNTHRTLYGRPDNVMIVTWEDDTDAERVEGMAQDDDPDSASYAGTRDAPGLYRKPRFFAINLEGPFTVPELDAIARRHLNKRIGLAEVVDLDVIADPTRDVWDVIRARDDELGFDAKYVIDQMTLPLRAGEASITTRRRRL